MRMLLMSLKNIVRGGDGWKERLRNNCSNVRVKRRIVFRLSYMACGKWEKLIRCSVLLVGGERLRKRAAKPLGLADAQKTGAGGIWARYKEDEFEYIMLYRERWKIFDAASHGEGK